MGNAGDLDEAAHYELLLRFFNQGPIFVGVMLTHSYL